MMSASQDQVREALRHSDRVLHRNEDSLGERLLELGPELRLGLYQLIPWQGPYRWPIFYSWCSHQAVDDFKLVDLVIPLKYRFRIVDFEHNAPGRDQFQAPNVLGSLSLPCRPHVDFRTISRFAKE